MPFLSLGYYLANDVAPAEDGHGLTERLAPLSIKVLIFFGQRGSHHVRVTWPSWHKRGCVKAMQRPPSTPADGLLRHLARAWP